MIDGFFIFLLIAAIIFLFVFILRLPIIIAKRRNLKESDIGIIALLSWVSLLVGVTWVIALVMSLVYKPDLEKTNNLHPTMNIDKLSQLFELKEKGVLTRKEFDTAKKSLLQ